MISAFLKGDVDGALAIERGVIASFTFESSDEAPNPVPTKAMLRALGLPAGQCRLPLGIAPSAVDAQAHVVHEDLETWRERRLARA